MNVPICGRRTVNTAEVPQRLSDSAYPVKRVDVFALSDNSGTVRIGGDTVCCISGRECGAPLSATDVFTIEGTDLHQVWIDAGTADDGVTWTAIVDG